MSQLLHDFILGALLGDKESEDWALAMLWPGLQGETGQPGAQMQLAPAVTPSPAYEGEPMAAPGGPMVPGRSPAVSPPMEMRPPEPGGTVRGMADVSARSGPAGHEMQLLSAPSTAGVERPFGQAWGRRGRGRRGMRRRGGPPRRVAGRGSPEPEMAEGREPRRLTDEDDRPWSPEYTLPDTVTPGAPPTVAPRINVPVLGWTAPSEPVDPELYDAYMDTHGRAQYTPGGKQKRWHEPTDPLNLRVAWYVWHGVHWEEAEQRATQTDVHMRELLATHPWSKLAHSMSMFEPPDLDWMLQPPPQGEQQQRLPPVSQRHEDLLRIEHAIESLGKLIESGHPEYAGYHALARETPIEIWPWVGRRAAGRMNPYPWGPCIYLQRSDCVTQDQLLTQMVHELQHVYDFYWLHILLPIHDEEAGTATPLELQVAQDYLDSVARGEISEEGLPCEPSVKPHSEVRGPAP